MPQAEQSTDYIELDETIAMVERLYRAVTGKEVLANNGPYAPIPAEKDPAQHVDEQLNRLLNMLGQADLRRDLAPCWAPPTSVWESPTEILICLDLPGVKRTDLQVTAQGNMITVSGCRLSPRNNSLQLGLNECLFGSFRRTVCLPGGMHAAEPSAEMKDGVLAIRIQKERDALQGTAPRPVSIT
jgi:HSP20 family molecular chaperone IbpA